LSNAPDPGLTATQTVVGTANYMAPEQREQPQEVDHRADIYSLGVVFYEMLTGEVPMGRFEPPSRKVRLDVRLDEVVLHAMEREPARRYQQASEIKTGVETIAATMGQQPPDNAAPNHRRFGMLPLVVLGTLVVILGIMLANWHWKTRQAPPLAPKAPDAARDNVAPANQAVPGEPAPVRLEFVRADSEEGSAQYGYGENAVDGNPDTYWHTQWQGRSPGLPHEIVIELVPPSIIKGFTYLPRQDESDHGIIRDYEFYVSDDGKEFGQPVKKGAFKSGREQKSETFKPIKCRFIKLRALSEINGLAWSSAAEIGVIQ